MELFYGENRTLAQLVVKLAALLADSAQIGSSEHCGSWRSPLAQVLSPFPEQGLQMLVSLALATAKKLCVVPVK